MVFVKAIRNQMGQPFAEVRRTTGQPHLVLAIVQARRFSPFSHIVLMPDETDAKKTLTASPWELEVTTSMPSYYMDEDYPGGHEVQ